MRRRLIIGGALALILLIGGLLLWSGHPPKYRAEMLLAVRPFTNALLRLSFERQIINSNPGVVSLDFQTSTFSLNGAKAELNGVMRLVAAGSTPTEAEQLARKAAEGVRVTLQQSYGTIVTILGPARSYAASAFRQPFRLRFRNAAQGPFPTAGPVYFQRPGISINPGDGWMRHYMLGLDPVCDPQLIGQRKFNGDFLQPVLLGLQSTNVESGVAELRPSIAQQPGFIQSSCKEEAFTSDSGLHGLHVSFARKYPVPNPRGAGMILLTPTTHYYLVTNAHSRCAGIVYVTITGKESEQVQRMIRSTLRLEP